MTRGINFSAGPATIHEDILHTIQEDLFNWNNTGMSVMEISHRSVSFREMLHQARQDLIDLLNISQDYEVLFLTSSARTQFGMIPLNLLGEKTTADYIVTGAWSKMASIEAAKYTNVNVIANNKQDKYLKMPDFSNLSLSKDAGYVYYAANETLTGLELYSPPEVGDRPLVSDMSSTLLSRPIDVSAYGLIFAGTQKNIGPSGVTIMIVRKDLIASPSDLVPSVFNYQLQAAADSLYNTPNTFGYYMAGLNFKWLKKLGGLEEMAKRNQAKALKLYDFIDNSSLYFNQIAPENRSYMNVTFNLTDANLESAFLEQAKEHNLLALKGHRSIGGLRASLYNSMSMEGINRLVEFMQYFAGKVRC